MQSYSFSLSTCLKKTTFPSVLLWFVFLSFIPKPWSILLPFLWEKIELWSLSDLLQFIEGNSSPWETTSMHHTYYSSAGHTEIVPGNMRVSSAVLPFVSQLSVVELFLSRPYLKWCFQLLGNSSMAWIRLVFLLHCFLPSSLLLVLVALCLGFPSVNWA